MTQAGWLSLADYWLSLNCACHQTSSLVVFALPAAHRKRLRTTNDLERLNRELKCRTRVSMLFQNEAALLRWVTDMLMDQGSMGNGRTLGDDQLLDSFAIHDCQSQLCAQPKFINESGFVPF